MGQLRSRHYRRLKSLALLFSYIFVVWFVVGIIYSGKTVRNTSHQANAASMGDLHLAPSNHGLLSEQNNNRLQSEQNNHRLLSEQNSHIRVLLSELNNHILLSQQNNHRLLSEQQLKDEPRIDYKSEYTVQQMIAEMQLHKANQSQLAKLIDEVNRTRGFIGNDTKPSNPHPFKYIINNRNICKGKTVFLVCYVHTAPSNYKRRAIIRDTWGNPKNYQNAPIQLVFVAGKTSGKPEIQRALEYESAQYNDIIQEDFEDDYHNLTYKGIGALKWISLNCRHAKFVLKTDDDIFINMFTLLSHLQRMDEVGDNKGVVLCVAWYGQKVLRKGRWKVTKEQYALDWYPPYCSGSAYTMSIDVAFAFHHVSYYVPFLWVDDFYHTGLLPMKLGLKIRQFMSAYVLNGDKFVEKFTGPQWNTYIFSHVHNLNQIQAVWHKLVDMIHGRDAPKIRTLDAVEAKALHMEVQRNQTMEEFKKLKESWNNTLVHKDKT